VVLGVALVLLAGCGPDGPRLYPVTGRVVYRDGRPVPGGVVEFDPGGRLPVARGTLDADGRFVLTTDGRAGAVAGEHRVVVVQVGAATAAGVAHAHKGAGIHKKYARFDTSGLTRTVRPDAANDLVIEVDAGR
jgi:hypothetical protein